MWEEIGNHDKAELDHADKVYRRWMETRLKNGSLVGWLVENKEGEVAGGGCLWLQPVQPRPKVKRRKLPYLLSMYTEPRFRGNGVATLIVEEAINWSRENGYSRLTLHASEMGRGVYRRLGFERTWEMRLKLSP